MTQRLTRRRDLRLTSSSDPIASLIHATTEPRAPPPHVMPAVHSCAVTLGAIARPSAPARGSPRAAIGARAPRASTRVSAASSSWEGTLYGTRTALSGAATPAARFTATRAVSGWSR